MATITQNSEYKRGYQNCMKHYSGYRSFFIKNGILYGYSPTGSKKIVSRYADKREVFKTRWSKEDIYWGGFYAAMRHLIKTKPTKSVKKKKLGMISTGW